MKITMVNGQNHKGSTYYIGKVLIDNISCEKEVKEFFLPKDLNHFCAGCFACIRDETKCPYYEEKNVIMKEIEESDLLIFTTPNYCLSPSAPMKAFIDLTFTYWFPHKPRASMFSKKAIVISTTAGAGVKHAINPVARTLFYWGVPWVKKYGISVQAMSWNGVSKKKKDKIYKDMKALGSKLSKCKRPHGSIKAKLIFYMMRKMQISDMGSGPEEKKYWEDRGWLGKKRPWKFS